MAGRSGFFAEVDEMTLARARRGDVGALESVYHTYSPAVLTLASRLCGSIEDGEEVLQDTFLEVVRRIGSFRGEGAFGAWLRKVTVSKVLMHHRRRRSRPLKLRELELAEVEGNVVDHRPSGRLDARFDVERALAGLPETTRMVLWLHEVEGMTHAEIAQLLGRSVSFSKSQLSRGYDRLRRWSSEEGRRNHASDIGRDVGIAGR
jgi:RNA polymerase sigma-70 factor (ECF subfamily)